MSARRGDRSVAAARRARDAGPAVARIPDLIDRAAERFGDDPFLGRPGASGWTWVGYREAARRVHALADVLRGAGVAPGVRVALMSENRPEWGIAYLAILAAEAVAVPLDVQLQGADAGEILAGAGARFVLASPAHRDRLADSARERGIALAILPLDGETPVSGAAPAAGSAGAHDHDVPAGLAALLFTSGTTGRPKGVMLTHANILSNIDSIEAAFHFGSRDRFLSVLPLHHAFECTVGLLTPLRIGASVAYARSLKSAELREDLASSGATILLGVPLLHEKLLAAIERGIAAGPRMVRLAHRATRALRRRTGVRAGGMLLAPVRRKAGLGTLRMLVSGAAPLPPYVYDGFTDLGFLLLEGYGLTECSPVVSANRPERSGSGSVGWPLPGVEVRIHEPDANGEGEIAVRGPNVMQGYWRQPVATAEVLRHGWFHSGDLGRLTADRRIVITGRLKNLIVTAAGKKIYPEEIEVRLSASKYVRESAVQAGRAARDEREEVHAHVVPEMDAIQQLAAARQRTPDDEFVREVLEQEIEVMSRDLAPFKRVRKLIIRKDPLPRTSTGKVKRDALD